MFPSTVGTLSKIKPKGGNVLNSFLSCYTIWQYSKHLKWTVLISSYSFHCIHLCWVITLLSYFTTYAHYQLHKSLSGNHCWLVVLPASGLIHNACLCGTVMKITAIWYDTTEQLAVCEFHEFSDAIIQRHKFPINMCPVLNKNKKKK
jgi:hypothetical protein